MYDGTLNRKCGTFLPQKPRDPLVTQQYLTYKEDLDFKTVLLWIERKRRKSLKEQT